MKLGYFEPVKASVQSNIREKIVANTVLDAYRRATVQSVYTLLCLDMS